MSVSSHEGWDPLRHATEALASFATLQPSDCDAIEALSTEPLVHRRGDDISALGLHLVASGWACKMRPVADGQRQIFVFLLPGDFIGSFRSRSEHSFYRTVALTRLESLDASPLIATSPGGASAMPAVVRAGQGLEDHAQGLIFDHLVRLGARDAYSGLADLLLELRDRLARIGKVDAEGAFTLPIGQRVLAHALGVSVVHVNQTLKRLSADGLIEVRGASIRLTDPQAMATLVGFGDHGDAPRLRITRALRA